MEWIFKHTKNRKRPFTRFLYLHSTFVKCNSTFWCIKDDLFVIHNHKLEFLKMTIDFYILQFDGECLQIILSFYRFKRRVKYSVD